MNTNSSNVLLLKCLPISKAKRRNSFALFSFSTAHGLLSFSPLKGKQKKMSKKAVKTRRKTARILTKCIVYIPHRESTPWEWPAVISPATKKIVVYIGWMKMCYTNSGKHDEFSCYWNFVKLFLKNSNEIWKPITEQKYSSIWRRRLFCWQKCGSFRAESFAFIFWLN